MGFETDDLKDLLADSNNGFLSKASKDKYDKFKDKDPFPDIKSALLNAEDIIKYILTTGMIDPFTPEKLQGATYSCTFSGRYLKFDSEGKGNLSTLSDGEALSIEPNSITYLEINERFMIPLYMVLRFNLKVPHVYKGLLLGTGPIVDPGFIGRLYIPLHNLTLNKYNINKGAELISVEFTKLSMRKDWLSLSKTDVSLVKRLNFSKLPKNIQKNIKADREIFEYLVTSLQGDKLFHKEPIEALSVGSSLEKNVRVLENLDEKVNESLNNVKAIKNRATAEVILAILGILITVIAIIVPISQAFDAIHKERVEYRDTLSLYQEKVDNLEHGLIELQIESKKEKIDLLTNEYASFSNNEIPDATEIYNQIMELEKEIAALEEQLS